MLINLSVKTARNTLIDSTVTTAHGLSVRGTVSEKSVPIPCRIRLFEKLSGRLIADQVTDKNGNYKFDGLAKITFFIVAHHPKNKYNAVIQDNVVPK